MHAAALPSNPIQILAAIGVFALVIWLRMRRLGRTRPLRIAHLWIVPAIVVALAGFVIWRMPPTLADAPWLAGAALIGAVLGWYRGKIMRISVDPETHAVSQSASPWAMIFLLALIGARFAARYALSEEAESWRISLTVLTDAPLLLLVALLTTTRIEMFMRAQRLLKAAKTAKSGAETRQ